MGSPFHQRTCPAQLITLGFWSERGWSKFSALLVQPLQEKDTIRQQTALNKDKTMCCRLHTMEFRRENGSGRGRKKLQNVYMAEAWGKDLGYDLLHSCLASMSALPSFATA